MNESREDLIDIAANVSGELGMKLTRRHLFLFDLVKEGLFTLDQELLNTQITLGVVGRQISQFLDETLSNFTIGIGEIVHGLVQWRGSTLFVDNGRDGIEG